MPTKLSNQYQKGANLISQRLNISFNENKLIGNASVPQNLKSFNSTNTAPTIAKSNAEPCEKNSFHGSSTNQAVQQTTKKLITHKTKNCEIYDKPNKVPCLEKSKTFESDLFNLSCHTATNVASSSCQTTDDTLNKQLETTLKRSIVEKIKQNSQRTTNALKNCLSNKLPKHDIKLYLSNGRTKTKNPWEKPKTLIDSINKLNKSNSMCSSKNLANNRLKIMQKKLQEEQQNSNVNESCNNLRNTSSGSNNQTTKQQSQSSTSTITSENISAHNYNSYKISKHNGIEPMDWEPMNNDNETVYNKSTDSPTMLLMSPLQKVKCNNDLNDVEDNYSSEFDIDLDFSNKQNFSVTKNNHSDSNNESIQSQTNSACNDDLDDSSRSIMGDIMRDLFAQLKRDAEHESLPDYKNDCMYFVLDTNVLLNYINFVDELTKISLCDTAGGMLYIPYVVIRELDSLKERKDDEFIRDKAVRAMRYLNSKFDDSNDIQAQNAQDEYKYSIHIDNHDDSIINCCLQLKDKVTNFMLLTDDQNMCLKAKANQISVYTKSDFLVKYAKEFAAKS